MRNRRISAAVLALLTAAVMIMCGTVSFAEQAALESAIEEIDKPGIIDDEPGEGDDSEIITDDPDQQDDTGDDQDPQEDPGDDDPGNDGPVHEPEIEKTRTVRLNNFFDDVKSSSWYYSYVAYAYENGLMNGVADRIFEPGSGLTRGMFVTILGRLAGADTGIVYPDSGFSDVPGGKWFSPYVDWAYSSGITTGIEDGLFGVDMMVTREQMAVFIARYVDYAGIELGSSLDAVSSFRDSDTAHSWAVSGIDLMRESGIIKGDTEGNFNPLNGATRAEAATIFNRLDIADSSVREHSVIFYTDGGTSVEKRTVKHGRSLVMIYRPQKEDCVLEGWYTDSGLTRRYDFSKAVVSDLTLYAKWTDNSLSSSADRGDTVIFGSYEQDGSTSNGKESMKWIVLKKQAGRILLLSKYGIDNKQYNSDLEEVTWKICSLRKWLNSDFINSAFSSSERSRVIQTEIENPDTYWGFDDDYNYIGNNSGKGITEPESTVPGCGSTEDKAFLLSCDEARDMLWGYDEEQLYETEGFEYPGFSFMQASATDYAKAEGSKTSNYCVTKEGFPCCLWMLRSPGPDNTYVSIVDYNGRIYNDVVNKELYSVRPAVWVSIN